MTDETRHEERSIPVGPILVVVAVVAIAVACGLIFMTYRAAELAKIEAVRAQEIAAVERLRAEASAAFLTNALANQDPSAGGSDVTVREVLDRAVEDLDNRFDDRPDTEAAVRVALAEAYRDIGDHDTARTQYEIAWALSETLDDPTLATSIATALVSMHEAQGNLVEARRWRSRAGVSEPQ